MTMATEEIEASIQGDNSTLIKITSTTTPAPTQTTATDADVDSNSTNKNKSYEEIRGVLPASTGAERERFLYDQGGDVRAAIDKLRKYLEWNSTHSDRADDSVGCDNNNTEHDNEVDAWVIASHLAILKSASYTRGSGDKSTTSPTKSRCNKVELPCILFVHDQQLHNESSSSTTTTNDINNTTNNKRYVHFLPARIDTKLAKSSVYALAIAIFVNHILNRASTEKITLVIDVRPGYGWANIKAINLVPFIQSTCRLMTDLHPERLNQCIIFPMPKVALGIWKAVKPFLDKETADKVRLVSGAAGKKDPVPKKLGDVLDKELIQRMEEERVSLFVRKG